MDEMEEWAPGFRFFPTEEELVSFYLSRKLNGDHLDLNRVIPVVDIYQLDPWYLQEHSGEVCRGDPEQWFFFCPRQEREARGGRPNRITNSGYWKATGSPIYVFSSSNKIIGVKKTMVFYKGKAPTGKKTKWKMNEYKAVDGEAAISSTSTSKLRHELSLCRVYIKSGCLRAFDRRPPVTTDQAPPAHQVQVANVTLPSHQSPPNAGRTSSPDTSFSGDDTVHTSQMGSAADWEVAQDLDQFFEWDQMDWPSAMKNHVAECEDGF